MQLQEFFQRGALVRKYADGQIMRVKSDQPGGGYQLYKVDGSHVELLSREEALHWFFGTL